ncbi:hypothetical protein FB566_1717 [Stackebrandtia endophytica]|uniref:Excreted virulence factor EspC (Type VII ESX diderm) n=1 Tax=Stackebrandtia endophytica TaxID=1496996 RepID=A0A543AUG5_9ACTN|nr:hypothetical protein [Stackebrandtia endophytica]TQL76195.1 hypothetical protein FB566_1717 [Stackebrandtia endophytica]
MPDKDEFLGNTTAIDTEGLWLCGHSFFPSMAVSHAQAAGGVGDAAGTGAEAFSRERSAPYPPYSASGSGPIYPAYVAVRDEFQNVLSQSVQNLYAVGDALERIAWAADAADGETATLMGKVEGYLESDADDTDSAVPIWREDDRPMPETPEESEERREEEREAAENRPPGPPY